MFLEAEGEKNQSKFSYMDKNPLWILLCPILWRGEVNKCLL